MKLSEAIRLGAMLKPQARDGLDGSGRSCALQAAADAIGLSTDRVFRTPYVPLARQWPILDQPAEMPAGVRDGRLLIGGPLSLMSAIYHLNDVHGWSREQIADWVESLESQVSRVLRTGDEEKKAEKTEEYAR